MELTNQEKKYWQLVQFEDETIAALCKDGQLYMFDDKDILDKLDTLPKDKYGWFFNNSKDRYCAERNGDNRICVNPNKVFTLFGPILIWNT